MVKMGKIVKIAASFASKSPECGELILKLLARIEESAAKDWEVNQKGIRKIIAERALEQWTKLDKNTPIKDYDRKRIIDALVTGMPDLTDDGASDSDIGPLDSIIHSLDPIPQDLETLVLTVLHAFKPIYLQKSAEYSIGKDGHLVEGAWQREFYRAATTVLPSGMYIIPEASTKFGKVDFYVHTEDKKIKWCIDLVREGDLLDEHVQKFEMRGEGEQLSDKSTKKGDYMILDFREAGKNSVNKEKVKKYANVWFVNYSETFTNMSVSCLEPTTSKLMMIKTIQLPLKGYKQCSAFDQLQEEIIQLCKDYTIASLRSQANSADTTEDLGYSTGTEAFESSCKDVGSESTHSFESSCKDGVAESTHSLECSCKDSGIESTHSFESICKDGVSESTHSFESNCEDGKLQNVEDDNTNRVESIGDIIDKWLDDEDINKVIALIKKQFQNVTGLHNCLIGHSYRSFPKTEGAFIQILNVDGTHWITVQHEPKSGIVHVYDSIYKSTSEDAKRQIAALLRTKHKRIKLKVHKMQYQKENTTCGLFAVAFATDLAHGHNPSGYQYKEDHLWSHFIKCLSDQKMTRFPYTTAQIPGPPKREYIEVFCTCRLPANGSMVPCSVCKEKYHTSCITNSTNSSTLLWKCSTCNNEMIFKGILSEISPARFILRN